MAYRDGFIATVIIAVALFSVPIESEAPEFDSFYFANYSLIELRCCGDQCFPSNVTWSKDGVEISENSRVVINKGKLTLTYPYPLGYLESGVYKCKQCNFSNCTIHSHLVYVNGYEYLYKKVVINTSASVHCALSEFFKKHNIDHETHSYFHGPCKKGFVTDNDIRGGEFHYKDRDLILDPVSYSSGGNYGCKISSFFGNYSDDICIVVVSNEKEIALFGRSKFIFKSIGSKVAFHIDSDHHLDYEVNTIRQINNFTWTKNDEPLNFTGSVYVLENLTSEDTGVYKAKVESSSIFRFWLVVGSVLKNSKMQNKLFLPSHAYLSLDCDTIFTDYGMIVSVDVVTSDDPNRRHMYKRWTSFRIDTNMFDYNNIQWYTCILTNYFIGEFNETVQIQRYNQNQIYTEDEGESVHASVGSNLTFSCHEFMNSSESNLTWTKNGILIEPKVNKVYSVNESIYLHNLDETDTGEYKCLRCNQFTSTCYRIRHWLIVGSLTDGNTENAFAKVHSDTVLTCTKKYYPFIKRIKWTKIDDIKTKPRPLLDFVDQDYTGRFNELRFENVTHQDSGSYLCEIETYFDDVQKLTFHKTIKLTVSDTLQDTIISKPPEDQFKMNLLYISILITALLTGLCISLAIIFLKKRHKKRYLVKRVVYTTIAPQDRNHAEFQLPNLEIEMTQSRSPPTYEFVFPIDENWEVARPVLKHKLGEGQFGAVFSAEVNGVQVAVKQLQEDCNSNEEVLSFSRELEIMKIIGEHPNIVRLCGCCSREGPLLIVIEYAPHGSLRNFLLEHRIQQPTSSGYELGKPPLSVEQLVWFANQVAQGMEYLASIKYVHRDLAARNVLVFDDSVVKISDFGLTRGTRDKDYYRKTTSGLIPAAWMAPESLQHGFYNSQSDVYSFGVLLWEVMTLGNHPYVMQEKQLKRPRLCPDDVYGVMRRCWRYKPNERPTFSELVEQFEDLDLSIPELTYDNDITEESETEL